MTRAGSPGRTAFSRSGRQARVRWNTPFTLSARTLSQAESGYSARGAPQFAPALFTSTWSAGSRAEIARDHVDVLLLPRGDVDVRTVLDEALRDHAPDAARPAGHQHHLVANRE